MPVDLANLLVDVSFGGLSEGATGPGVSLRWTNGMKNGSSFTDIQTGVGINWSLNLTGRVLSLGSNKFLAFFEPTNRGQKFYFTKETDGSFTPDNPCNAELEATSTEYLLKINGIKIVYYKTGGGTIIESITERSYVGTDSTPADADYDPMARIEFEIPSSAVSGRCPANSLYRVKFQTPVVSGGATTWTTNRTKMFIYSTSATSDYYAGAMKYVIDESGYASLSNPEHRHRRRSFDCLGNPVGWIFHSQVLLAIVMCDFD